MESFNANHDIDMKEQKDISTSEEIEKTIINDVPDAHIVESYNNDDDDYDEDYDEDEDNDEDYEDDDDEKPEVINATQTQLKSLSIDENKPNCLLPFKKEDFKKSVDEYYKEFDEFVNNHTYYNEKDEKKKKTGRIYKKTNPSIKINAPNERIKDSKIFYFDGDNTEYFRIVRVGNPLGTIYLTLEDYKIFIIKYNYVICHPDFIFDYKKYQLNFVECLYDVCDLILDFDINYKDEIKEGRIYDTIKEEIINISCETVERISGILNIKGYLFEKEKATFKTDKEGNYYKDGFHLIFCYPFKKADRIIIRNELIKEFKKAGIFNKIDCLNTVEKIVDNSTFITQPCMMFRSGKNDCGHPENFYELEGGLVYNDNNEIDINDNEEYNYGLLFSTAKYLINNIEAIEIIKPININSLTDEHTPLSDLTPKNTKKMKLDAENSDLILLTATNKYAEFKDWTIDDLRILALQILKIKYIDDYPTWRNIIWSILSFIENYEQTYDKTALIKLIHEMSKRSKNYNEEETDKLINAYNPEKGTTLEGLKKYCLASNKRETEKVLKNIEMRTKQQKRQEILKDREIKIFDTELKNKDVIYENPEKDEDFDYNKLYNLFKNDTIIKTLDYFYKFNYYVEDADGSNIYRYKKILFKEDGRIKKVVNVENEYYKPVFNYNVELIKLNKRELINNIPITHKKILCEEEYEFLENNYFPNYGDLIDCVDIKKEEYSITLRKLIEQTLPLNKYNRINDNDMHIITKIKYYNKYEFNFKTERYININIIANEFYFNNILSSYLPDVNNNDYGIKELNEYIKNVVCMNKPDDDIELINKKYYYVMNFLRVIFNCKKNNTALVLSGLEGTGKSTLSYLIKNIVGNKIGHIEKGEALFNKFNKYNSGIFNGSEELLVAENYKEAENIYNKLKDLITNDTIEIEYKNIESSNLINKLNIVITTNQLNFMKISPTDRRLSIFNMFDIKPKEYFRELYDNFINNEIALKNFYNWVKLGKFEGALDVDIFRRMDAIDTPEKRNLIINLSDTFYKFLIEFYYEGYYFTLKNINCEYLKNNLLVATPKKFYDYYCNYCKFYGIVNKNNYNVFYDKAKNENGLLTYNINGKKSHEKKLYISLPEFQQFLIKKNLLNLNELDYDFSNKDDLDNFKPFNNFGFNDDETIINIK